MHPAQVAPCNGNQQLQSRQRAAPLHCAHDHGLWIPWATHAWGLAQVVPVHVPFLAPVPARPHLSSLRAADHVAAAVLAGVAAAAAVVVVVVVVAAAALAAAAAALHSVSLGVIPPWKS